MVLLEIGPINQMDYNFFDRFQFVLNIGLFDYLFVLLLIHPKKIIILMLPEWIFKASKLKTLLFIICSDWKPLLLTICFSLALKSLFGD